jgi:hypothetical protein
MATEQGPVPEQPPLHPENVEPPVAVAVNVTELPLGKLPLQEALQVMPPGELLTMPPPAPAMVTVSAAIVGDAANSAVTLWLLVMVTLQAPVPIQPPPLHPVNVAPPVAVAVSVTVVPGGKLAVQVALHPLMPTGALLIVPAPVPPFTTVSVMSFGCGLNVALTV